MYIKNYTNNNFQSYTKVNTVFDLQGLEFQKNHNTGGSFFFDIRSDNWSDILNKYKITNKIEIYDECIGKDVFVGYIRGYNFTESGFLRIYGNDDIWVYDNTVFEFTFTEQNTTYTINEIINWFYILTGSNNIRNNIIVEENYGLFTNKWDISGLSRLGLFDQIKEKFPQLYRVFKDGKIYITDKDKYDVILQGSYRYDQDDLANNTIQGFEVKNNRDSYKLPFVAPGLYEELYIDISVVPSDTKEIEVGYKKRVYVRGCDGAILADYTGIIQSIEYKLGEIDFYNVTVSNGKTYTGPYLKNANRFLREKLY